MNLLEHGEGGQQGARRERWAPLLQPLAPQQRDLSVDARARLQEDGSPSLVDGAGGGGGHQGVQAVRGTRALEQALLVVGLAPLVVVVMV